MRETSALNLVMGSVRVWEHELKSLFFSSWTQTSKAQECWASLSRDPMEGHSHTT